MKTRCAVAAALILVPIVLAAQKPTPIPVRVFVTSAGAMNGFTDPSKDNQDTVKDLLWSLKRKKGVALSDEREQAQIVLVVQNRETAAVTAGFLGDPARDRIIRVTFIVNGNEIPMQASAQGGTLGSGGAWSKAAGKIASQVEDWVKANGARLQAAQ